MNKLSVEKLDVAIAFETNALSEMTSVDFFAKQMAFILKDEIRMNDQVLTWRPEGDGLIQSCDHRLSVEAKLRAVLIIFEMSDAKKESRIIKNLNRC